MTITAGTINKLNALSDESKSMVVSFIDQLDRDESGRPKKRPRSDFIGLVLLKLNSLFGSREPISDEEIDAVIGSVRKEQRAQAASN